MNVLLTYDNQNDHVAPNETSPRYMHSHGELFDDGTLSVTTRTWTNILLGGFHGAVHAEIYDAYNRFLDKTDVHTFGVDGKWIGRSDRTDSWTYTFDPAKAAQAKSIKFVNSWDPQWLQSVQNTIHFIGMLVDEIAAAFAQSGRALLS
jgi:hypothetical protein